MDELGARAVEHGDEHVLKFTEACRREYALRPDPRFRAAVAVARRIAPLGK
ncbi:Questin oxidase family protein OS=Streptomyces rimosus subsp. rimosus (strain ATCC / DSM 40260/ JCM 4667 / NRRL 2234) OX=1265868 GN=SRIM_018045 PE=4 SV=1 [Streptomyces rimosus subsp. rimosus]